MLKVKRGDIFWINLDPTLGSEIKKTRPCVIVSNDVANQFSSLITILPITTQKLSRVFPHEVMLEDIGSLKNSKVKANQIRTVDKMRLGKKISALPTPTMNKINFALASHLDLTE
jgi:mRNA interferase MazF